VKNRINYVLSARLKGLGKKKHAFFKSRYYKNPVPICGWVRTMVPQNRILWKIYDAEIVSTGKFLEDPKACRACKKIIISDEKYDVNYGWTPVDELPQVELSKEV